MSLTLEPDDRAPDGGHAILRGPGLTGVDLLSIENCFSPGMFLGEDGRWGKARFACPVEPIAGQPDAVALGPHIADFLQTDLQVAFRTAAGGMLGRVFWSDINPSRNPGRVTSADILKEREQEGTRDNQRRLEEQRKLDEQRKLEEQRQLDEQRRLEEQQNLDEQRRLEEQQKLDEQRRLEEQQNLDEQRRLQEQQNFDEPRRLEEQRKLDGQGKRKEKPHIPLRLIAVGALVLALAALLLWPRLAPPIPPIPPISLDDHACPRDVEQAYQDGLAKSTSDDVADLVESERLLTCALKAGKTKARHKLGRLYVKMATAVSRPLAEELEFYKRACDEGDREGCGRANLRFDR